MNNLFEEWDGTASEAIRLQLAYKSRIILKNSFDGIHYLAGCDMSLDRGASVGFGGIIVYTWPGLREVERVSTSAPLTFPYIPGLLSFREAPVLLKTYSLLKHEPDIIIFDGQGIAHPRGMGIASHMGLLLDKPSLGCGKSKLYGKYEEPGPKRGDTAGLFSNDGRLIGKVLRTKERCNPVFISPGHKIDLETSLKIILHCLDGFRIPKPTREADRYVAEIKK